MKTEKLFILIITSILIFSSCSKLNKEDELKKSNSSNFKNPFDSVGISHNIGLKYVRSHMNKSSATCSLSETYEMVVEGLEEEGVSGNWPTYDFVESVWSPIDHNIVIDSNYSIAICANQLFQQGAINSIQLDWFLQLNNIVKQNFGLPSYTSSIVSLENNLNSNQSMTNSQKSFILIGCSVAKYSGEYWASQMNNLKSAQYKWWQWGLIIGADVGGALVGASGGLAGSISASACCSAMAMGICTDGK